MNNENKHTGSDGTANEDRLPNRSNGKSADRDGRGRFQKGCKPGPGNPHAKEVANIREALLQAITPEAAKAIAAQLVKKAKAGNLPAIKELLDRVCGKAVAKIEAEVGPLQPSFPPSLAEYEEFNKLYPPNAIIFEEPSNGDAES